MRSQQRRQEFGKAGPQQGSSPASLHLQRLERDSLAAQIVGRVARAHGLTVRRLLSRTRGGAEMSGARQLAMYLLHVGMGRPQDAVGLIFRRHPSTVSHACHIVEDRRDDPAFDAEVSEFETLIAAPQIEALRHAG